MEPARRGSTKTCRSPCRRALRRRRARRLHRAFARHRAPIRVLALPRRPGSADARPVRRREAHSPPASPRAPQRGRSSAARPRSPSRGPAADLNRRRREPPSVDPRHACRPDARPVPEPVWCPEARSPTRGRFGASRRARRPEALRRRGPAFANARPARRRGVRPSIGRARVGPRPRGARWRRLARATSVRRERPRRRVGGAAAGAVRRGADAVRPVGTRARRPRPCRRREPAAGGGASPWRGPRRHHRTGAGGARRGRRSAGVRTPARDLAGSRGA